MRDVNSCTFIGRLGKDPEVRSMPNGDGVANLSIACSDDYKDKSGNKVEQTNWINIVAFRGLADVIGKYTKKGSKIYVRGKQVTRKWQDKEGNDRYTTEIVADDIQLLDKREVDPQQDSPQQEVMPRQPEPGGFNDFDDDIPLGDPILVSVYSISTHRVGMMISRHLYGILSFY